MAGGSVINSRVEDILGVSRSIGDVYFKRSHRDPKSISLLSLTRRSKLSPQTDIVIAEPDVETYPLSSSMIVHHRHHL